MKKIYQFCFLLALTLGAVSCSEEFDNPIVRDNRPDVPVTFTGATTYGFNPYYTVSVSAGGTFTLTMAIPSESGRKIKSIKKVIAGGTALTTTGLYDASTAYAANINVDATTVTINTSLTEFNSKVTAANRVATTIASGTIVERAFMFLVVLDDNSEIIPVQLRIRFVS